MWFPKYSALYHSYQRKRTADAIALPKILPTQAFVGNIFLTPPSSARDLQLFLCSINIANRLLRPLPGRKGGLLLQLSDLGFIDKMNDRFLTNQSIPVSKLFYKNIYNFREDLLRSPPDTENIAVATEVAETGETDPDYFISKGNRVRKYSRTPLTHTLKGNKQTRNGSSLGGSS